MPTAKYFQVRSKQRGVTGPDAVDLISSSTTTHQNMAAKGAPPAYAPLPHPPHSHAHISKEGFQHDLNLTDKQKKDWQGLKHNPKLGPKGMERKSRYEQRKYANEEGLHLDPAKRGMMVGMDPLRQIVDPTNKKGVVKAYVGRVKHSQFEDGEVAAMALVHSLNTQAGEQAMAWLTQKGRRVAITSKTAANALNAGPVPYKNPPKGPLSKHKNRGKAPQVIERGKGVSGKAPTPTAAIVAVTSVFDYGPGDDLTLVTHFPISAPAPAQDAVEFNDFYNPAMNKIVKYAAVAPAGPVAIEWVHPTPMLALSQSAGFACVTCATQHGRWWSSRFNPWYQCNRCGNVYCPAHGQGLAALPSLGNPHGRACSRPGCGGSTQYIY